MAVSITLKQTQSIQPDNLFRVIEEVTTSTDISQYIFVFTAETQAFSHVATVYDIEHIVDTTYAAVLSSGAEYYRLAVVQKDYETQSQAEAFAAYTRVRTETLVGDYESFLDGFEGITTYVYPEA